jgi:hypothetical protein
MRNLSSPDSDLLVAITCPLVDAARTYVPVSLPYPFRFIAALR